MPVETALRTRRKAVALMAFQSAKGAIQNNLQLGSNCIRVWTREAKIPAAVRKSDPRWMTEAFVDNQASRYTAVDAPQGTIFAVATPENVKAFLRSNWGPFAGSPATSTLKNAVNEYCTIAWVEESAGGSTKNLVQVQDAWLHRVRLKSHRTDGKLIISADFSGRATVVTPLNALGPIQLTPYPMAPLDQRIYNVRSAHFRRDPTGDNIDLDFIDLEFLIDQGLSAEWTQTDKWDVRKKGTTELKAQFYSKLDDETWEILNNNRSGTKEQYQFQASSDVMPSGFTSPSTLTIDLFNMDFDIDQIGHDDRGWCSFRGLSRALTLGGAPESGFCKFTIS